MQQQDYAKHEELIQFYNDRENKRLGIGVNESKGGFKGDWIALLTLVAIVILVIIFPHGIK